MDNPTADTLTARAKYLSILQKELAENKKQCENEKLMIANYEQIIENVKQIAEQPQRSCLLQVSEKVFISRTMVHTGEYLVEYQGPPTAHRAICTTAQTIETLHQQIEKHKKNLESLEVARKQLTEQIELISGNHQSAVPPVEAELVSQVGIAIRVGENYEIFEYEP